MPILIGDQNTDSQFLLYYRLKEGVAETMFLRPMILIAMLAAILGSSWEVYAQSETQELIQELALLRERVSLLEHQQEGFQEETSGQQGTCGEVFPASYLSTNPSLGIGHPRSRYPSLVWSGFLQLDTGWVAQDDANMAAVGDIESKTGLRRVRLRADGNVRPDISYVIDLDFAASGHPSFRDVKFTLHDQGCLQNIQIGYFQQPFGFDAMTSGRELLLLERQLPFAMVPFRQTGLGAYGTAFGEHISWSASGFRFPTDPFGVSQGDGGGWGFAQRVSGMHSFGEGENLSLIHGGASFSFINPGTGVVRYAIEPGFFVVDPTDQDNSASIPAFVDTGDIPTDNVNLVGLELATQTGSLNAQAEVIGSFVNQTNATDLGFYGVSGKLSFVLTGEVHPYDRQRGVFTRIVPDREGTVSDLFSGAWEIVSAYSILDLNDGNISGGKLQTLILGINRYLNQHTKFQFNLINAILDDSTHGESDAILAVFRAQAEF